MMTFPPLTTIASASAASTAITNTGISSSLSPDADCYRPVNGCLAFPPHPYGNPTLPRAAADTLNLRSSRQTVSRLRNLHKGGER